MNGGAIFGFSSVKGSIFTASAGGNCSTPPGDLGYNISDDTSCGFTKTGSANNCDNVDPLLDGNGLQNNGGPTQTIALQAKSPAIDAILRSRLYEPVLASKPNDYRPAGVFASGRQGRSCL